MLILYIIIYMAHQFACPACGGLIDYPEMDTLIAAYDLNDRDPCYYEDVFEEELKITCDWCKKRVEVPLDEPEGSPPVDPLKRFNEQEDIKTKFNRLSFWPSTTLGKIVIGAVLLIYILGYSAIP
jgi:hypothetical protein